MAAGGNGNTNYPPFPMTASKTTMVAGLNGGAAVRRIRSPNPQDVLSGRGGGINSHKGNKAFRQWVYERKEEYNLAQNKKEKIAVAMQVVRQVQQQVPIPGRFLQRDPTSVSSSAGQWWVEVDEAKALAKTTQALREGAPKIRQAHKQEDVGSQKTTEKAKKRKRKATVVASVAETETQTETPVLDDATEKLVLQTVKQDAQALPRYKSEQMLLPTTNYSVALEQLQENVLKAQVDADCRQDQGQPLQPLQQQATSTMTPAIAPLTSNRVFNQMYIQNNDTTITKPRFNPLMMPAVDPFAETPPLMAAPEPDMAGDIPVLSLDIGRIIHVDNAVPPLPKRNRLVRVHSLALSDVDGTNLDPAPNAEFVNPFADESNVLLSQNGPRGASSYAQSSALNQWNRNDAIDQPRSKVRSVGGYLNRLLSFSSSTSVLNDSENRRETRGETDNENSELNNEDYFFHDDILGNFFNGMHPDLTPTDSKNSTSSLIRHQSFTSRNRALESGRQ